MRKLLVSTAILMAMAASAHAAEPSAPATCTPGAWRVVEGNADDTVNNAKPVQLQTAHFAFHWTDGDVPMSDAVAAGQELELIWQTYMTKTAFPEPFCDTADKHKVNIFIGKGYGLSGGPTGERDMGMWIDPLALRDHWGLGHEFTHALQGSTRSLRGNLYGGWLWESHANWMAHQMDEYHDHEVHCSEMLVNYPHLYYGSTRDRYCNWQFLEYLKDAYGYKAVADIWANGLKPGQPGADQDDPFSILMRNMGWTIDELNDEFGRWALHNVTWDYTDPDGHDQGALYRRAYGAYDDRTGDRALRVTQLDPIDLAQHRFVVPFAWAPQRWGYNLVQLMPDAGASEIVVKFRGVEQAKSATATLPGLKNDPTAIADPASDWRWGVVAIAANGAPRYSPMVSGANADMTFKLQPGDKAVYMVVVATPYTMQKVQWDQAYYSLYRYPWQVELTGAMPQGYEANAPVPVPGGHRHPNGGGWVAANAHVDDTAYVGPYARVLGGRVTGHARIEDHAIVVNGTVSDDAVVGALSVIDGGVVVKDHAVVATTFKGPGAFERGAVIGGTAQVLGDAELRDGLNLSKGVYYGFIDKEAAADPAQGANLTAPVPEVTAKPDNRWQP